MYIKKYLTKVNNMNSIHRELFKKQTNRGNYEKYK